MHSIKVLDVTLRDGGCVNDFNFGKKYMDQILSAEELSGVDYIELGYIDDTDGAYEGRTKFISEKAAGDFIKNKKHSIEYLVMMDYGKFDVTKLSKASESRVDGIRLAFHRKNLRDIAVVGNEILNKGYKLFIQPMLTIHYTDKEILELIDIVNNDLSKASALYLVDSFGEMRANDVERILNIYDHNLNKEIGIGFHSHNNLQMSYANAISLIRFSIDREIIVDSSILGMGKGAGNLNTELLLEHLNLFYEKKYELLPLMEVIDNVLSPLKAEYNWGYSIEYYLSSKYHISPSYANYFYNKHSLSVKQLSELLSCVDEEKKISFDKEYAREIYREYKSRNLIDDNRAIDSLKKIISEKEVLLVAPGKNAMIYADRVKKAAQGKNVIVIGVNNADLIKVDYLMVTRMDMFYELEGSGIQMIALSNITDDPSKVNTLLNYSRWTLYKDETRDSSGFVVLRLMEYCKPKKIMLAGFDGLSYDINDNYYDETMRFAYTKENIKKNNELLREYISELKTKIEVEYITPSLYEEKND